MDLQSVFLTIWNMSLTGSIIIGFVLLARLVLRKAPKVFSYALWSVVLFRLLCPVSVSSVFSVLNFTKAAEPVRQSAVSTMEYAAVDMPLLIPGPEAGPEIQEPVVFEPEYEEVHIDEPVIPDDGAVIPEVPDAALPQESAEPAVDPIHYAVTIWLVGLGVMLICNVVSCIRLLRQIEGAVLLRKELYLADYISTAFVLGIIRPRIYLPSYLTPEEQGYIIAHERCHIKRKDHLFRLLGYLALCLHWFNPLVWLAFVLSGKDMEMSCDEAVIRMYGPRIRAEYAQSLLRLATGRRSFALTPLAFGEGDTKERVLNMTTWKKPKLWATLIALLACVAVLVACATNPASEVPTEEATEESAVINLTQTEYWDRNEDLSQVCADAIRKLIDSQSYCIVNEWEAGGNSVVTEYRKRGEDFLVEYSSAIYGSRLFADGKNAMFYGDYWVWEEHFAGKTPDEWLYRWSTDFVETSHVYASQDTISFDAKWSEEPSSIYKDRYYLGTLTYTFNPDGSLQSVRREYVAMEGDVMISGTVETIRPVEESPEDTDAAIQAVADQCITAEELEQKRLEKATVSDIPSNKTMYDTNYELGAGQMGWKFFDDIIKFKYGAVSDDGSSATITHYVTVDGVKSVVAEDSYWLEKLVDGKWQYVDKNITAVPIEKRNVETDAHEELSYKVDWSDAYGKLPAGFYRIGRYHTVTLDSGESETRPCYAKFRVMGENWEELLTRCENALEELLNRESYHLVCINYLTTYADPEETGYLPWIIDSHIYKSGNDFMDDTRYLDRNDNDLWIGRRGTMYRDRQNYSLDWTGRENDSPLSYWSRNDFSGTWDLWASTFEWYDSSIVEVVQTGDEISIMMELGEYGHGHKYKELRYYFKSDGTIDHIDYLYHPTEGITKMRDKILEDTLLVMDTSATDIRNLIDSQDVSKPISFSYEMDVEEFPDAKKDGFVNTTHQAVGDMETAIRLAEKECTMLVQDTLTGERYNVIEVYYDEAAKIWKVVLRYSQNVEGDQAIYIDNRGITQMVVTYTEENDPENTDN